MRRIQPVDSDHVEPPISAVLSQQAERWGTPLLPYLLYARRRQGADDSRSAMAPASARCIAPGSAWARASR